MEDSSFEQHLPAGATPAAAIPYLLAIYLSREVSKSNASGLLAGASHATAAVLAPGSTTIHTKVAVAATLGHKMPPFTKCSPAVPWGTRHGDTLQKLPRSWRPHGMSSVHPQRHEGFDQPFTHFHEAQQWELILAASSRSAQANSQHLCARLGILLQLSSRLCMVVPHNPAYSMGRLRLGCMLVYYCWLCPICTCHGPRPGPAREMQRNTPWARGCGRALAYRVCEHAVCVSTWAASWAG